MLGPESEYVVDLQGEVVNIQCGEGNHNHGSSKVKLIDRTDYNWELKYYHGHLVAAHITRKIIAYAMKGNECIWMYVSEHFCFLVENRWFINMSSKPAIEPCSFFW